MNLENRRNSKRLSGLIAFVLLGTGCRHLLREKVTPYPEAAPHAAPWRLNREFLLPESTSRILFVVTHEAGTEPYPDALDHLVGLASKYGERPASWVPLGDPGAPDVTWDRTGRLRCPSGSLDPSTSYIFIRYVGRAAPGLFGRTATLPTAPECGAREIYSMQIAQDTLRDHRFLWLTSEKLQENDLVHEYGHVLGLGSNPAHGYYPYYPDLSAGDHCINPDCALAGPRPRANLYRFYRTGLTLRYNRDFCRACQRDIDMAKAHWRTGAVFPESPRLPQRDLSEWIARLKDDDFREGGEAVVLLYHGKEVMPALMKRMLTLPEGEDSPRAAADLIAKAIVTQEALKRAGSTFGADWAVRDQSREMLWWWMKEGHRFMNGEDWELPEVVSLVPKNDPPSTEDAPSHPSPPPAR